jgi:hypothetical protein
VASEYYDSKRKIICNGIQSEFHVIFFCHESSRWERVG